ncbi:MAG: NAD+ synthase, partial [Gammaproteobacteria bacterium]|nr:NAD+ synthase [Gammaproteobacteria bacterium]
MIIGIAQINPCVGAIEKNKQLIIDCIGNARANLHVDTLIFPELALTGYPPEDLLYRPDLYNQLKLAIKELESECSGINIIFGYPRIDGDRIYNSCGYIKDGRLDSTYDKMMLPNYGVFDEVRYFSGGEEPCLIELGSIKASLTVCEDIWDPLPARQAEQHGAGLIININASPFHTNKLSERQEVLTTRNKETGLPIIYVNINGGQDELVFDGGSMIIDSDGVIKAVAPQFKDGIFSLTLEKQDDRVSLIPDWDNDQDLSGCGSVYQALVLAIKDYVVKNGFNGVVIGLSGGIDSALVT